ncbi:MAG TPA: phage protease [Candidatus Binataceae bacterium]
MDDLLTRAGGDRSWNAGNLVASTAINTASAPATSNKDFAAALPVGTQSGEGEGDRSATRAAHPIRAGVHATAIESTAAAGQPAPALVPPEWIELVPAGVFFGRDGRGPFRLEHPERVIAATVALQMAAGIPIDYDHATDFAAPEGRPAPAAGWIRQLQVRSGAIWGRVEWTGRAAAAIRAREYRYISPVFQFEGSDGKVTRLLRAGLTNNPNLYLTAIASAETLVTGSVVNLVANGAEHKDGIMEEFLKQLREILQLDDDATPDDIAERVREMCASADARSDADGDGVNTRFPDPARFVGIAEYQRAVTELHSIRAERAREKAAHAVDDAIRAGKLVPALREWAIAYCTADLKGFQAFAAKQPAIVGGEPAFPSDAQIPPSVMLSSSEVAICAQLGLRHSEFLKRKIGRRDFLSLDRGLSDSEK